MRIYKSFFRFEKCRKACKYRLYRLMRTYKEIVKNYILIWVKLCLDLRSFTAGHVSTRGQKTWAAVFPAEHSCPCCPGVEAMPSAPQAGISGTELHPKTGPLYAFFRVRKIPRIAPIKSIGANLTNSHSNA